MIFAYEGNWFTDATGLTPVLNGILYILEQIGAFFNACIDVVKLIIELMVQIWDFGLSLIDSYSRLPVSLSIPVSIILILTFVLVVLNIIKKIPLM